MMTLTRSLTELTAADVMKGPVEVFPSTMSLRAAAHKLSQAQVSGAPVVDGAGRCVGVLSSADFVRWAESHGTLAERQLRLPRSCPYWQREPLPGGKDEFCCTLPEGACPVQGREQGPDGKVRLVCRIPNSVLVDWQQVKFDELPEDEVSRYATPDPVTVPSGALVTALARMMVDAHIHRVIVVDAAGRPVGVVSSTDVLAAVAALHGPPA
jgi:CBS domain-containing protein